MAAKKKTDVSYAEGAQELDNILAEIESGDADIDVLSEKVERAADLIKLCREKLTKTELRVNKVVEELGAEQEEEE
ncbi:MAG: exodeoxyribonuclease VII small subunit [Planctomycetota bacterium]|jgi:exodeoxyribonuclease VII small subunit